MTFLENHAKVKIGKHTLVREKIDCIYRAKPVNEKLVLYALLLKALCAKVVSMREINNLNDMLPVLTYYEESNDFNEITSHFHCYHQLVLTIEGEANFKINQISHVAVPNSLVIIRAMDKHSVSVSQFPYKRYVLNVTSQLLLTAVHDPKLLSLFSHNSSKSRNFILLRPEIAEKFTAIFDKAMLECVEKKDFWTSLVVNLVFHILIELYREEPDMFSVSDYGGGIETIIQVQRFISENFRDKIDLDQLVEQFFISKFHLSRKFKAITGCSFKKYLTLHRINEAQLLLRNTNLPVSKISEKVGYDNPEHFIRIFHKSQGITPLQYRLRCKRIGLLNEQDMKNESPEI